jgi:hypothetical protein
MHPPQDSGLPPEDEVRRRAELLPEERAAGDSADATAQAAAILADSEQRVQAPHDPPDGDAAGAAADAAAQEHEHRTSADTV